MTNATDMASSDCQRFLIPLIKNGTKESAFPQSSSNVSVYPGLGIVAVGSLFCLH